MTLRRRSDGVRIRPTPIQVLGDPNDLEFLNEQLDTLGREHEGWRGDGWQHKYELVVRWGRQMKEHKIVVGGQVPR